MPELATDGPPEQPRTLRDQQRQLTRQRILQAAREAFTAIGVAAVTVDQIARDAGISRATLYLHFPNKEAILVALLRRDLTSVHQIFDPLGKAAREGQAAVARWIKGYVDVLKRHSGDLRLFTMATANDPEVVRLVRDHRASIALNLGGPAAAAHPELWTRLHLMIARIDQVASDLSVAAPHLDPETAIAVVAEEVVEIFTRIAAAGPAPA